MKKLLSIFLSIALTISMFPAMAFAAEPVVTVTNENELITAISNATDDVKTTIKLNYNIELSNKLEIPANKDIVLDLSHYELYRTLQEATADGRIIDVLGELTIESNRQDGYQAGKIQGANASSDSSCSGGAIYVSSDGVLNLKDGIITKNKAGYGAGVYVDGTLNMSGGSITENTSRTRGGGIYVTGTFNMSGGTISDNIVNLKTGEGGGIYIEEGSDISLNNCNCYGNKITWEELENGQPTPKSRVDDIVANRNFTLGGESSIGTVTAYDNFTIEGESDVTTVNAYDNFTIRENSKVKTVSTNSNFTLGGSPKVETVKVNELDNISFPIIHLSEEEPFDTVYVVKLQMEDVETGTTLVDNVNSVNKNLFKMDDRYQSLRYDEKTGELQFVDAYSVITYSDLVEIIKDWKEKGNGDFNQAVFFKHDMRWLEPIEISAGSKLTVYMDGHTINSVEGDSIFKNNGLLTLKDGTLTDVNVAAEGGAIVSNGVTTLENITIKNNKALKGAGVLVESGKLVVNGLTKISNNKNKYNKNDNVCLEEDAYIEIKGLSSDSIIGVNSKSSKDVMVASGDGNDSSSCFSSDVLTRQVFASADGNIYIVGSNVEYYNGSTVADLSDELSIARDKLNATVKVDLAKNADMIAKNVKDNNATSLSINAKENTVEYLNKVVISAPCKLFSSLQDVASFRNVTIYTNVAEITLDRASLDEILAVANESSVMTLEVRKTNPDVEDSTKDAYTVKLVVRTNGDDNKIENFNIGKLTLVVDMPEGMTGKKLACVTKDENGRATKNISLTQDNLTGTVRLSTSDLTTLYLVRESTALKAFAGNTKVTLSRVKAYKGKKAKLTFKRVKVLNTKFTKYQIYRSTSKKFNKNLKKFTVTNKKTSSTISYTNKKLKKGKRYYYKVRGVASVDGTTVYTNWSTVKSVKAK